MNMNDAVVPVIRLWGCLLVPIQGELTDDMAGVLQDQILHAIHAQSTRGLILDLSGIGVLDSHLCSVLARVAGAAALMGAPTAVCGMRAEMALTLNSMGIDMRGITSALTLEEALHHFGIIAQDQHANRQDKLLELLFGGAT
ncbi:MAG: STAS domain-containing protein [Myxococcota bacterium]